MLLIGDMDGKMGSKAVDGVVGKWGMPARVDEKGMLQCLAVLGGK